MNDEIMRAIITTPFVFAAFYAVPFLVEYMVQKRRIRLVGWEIILFVGPIAAIIFLFKQDWEPALFFLAASLGSHIGFFKVARRSRPPENSQTK